MSKSEMSLHLNYGAELDVVLAIGGITAPFVALRFTRASLNLGNGDDTMKVRACTDEATVLLSVEQVRALVTALPSALADIDAQEAAVAEVAS